MRQRCGTYKVSSEPAFRFPKSHHFFPKFEISCLLNRSTPRISFLQGKEQKTYLATMSPHSTILAALPFLLSLATAIPTTLSARDDHPSMLWTCGPGCAHTVFDDAQATCGSDKTLERLSTTVTVNVQPDCDQVIDTICKASDQLIQASRPMVNLAHTVGTCEGHLLFEAVTADQSTMSYAPCVKSFQDITSTCMLMGGAKNAAGVGKQFGLENVFYQLLPSGDDWTANNQWVQNKPGFLMGPPGVWGTNNWGTSKDANYILNPAK